MAASEQLRKGAHAPEIVEQSQPGVPDRVLAARNVTRVFGEGETAA